MFLLTMIPKSPMRVETSVAALAKWPFFFDVIAPG